MPGPNDLRALLAQALQGSTKGPPPVVPMGQAPGPVPIGPMGGAIQQLAPPPAEPEVAQGTGAALGLSPQMLAAGLNAQNGFAGGYADAKKKAAAKLAAGPMGPPSLLDDPNLMSI